MDTCNICCEVSRKFVCCKFCNESACQNCVKHYLEDSALDPHCMYCKKMWTKDYLYNILPKTYINTALKRVREDVLLDREKAMMPATQQSVEQFLHQRKQQKIVNDLYAQRKELHQQLRMINENLNIAYRNMQIRIPNAENEIVKCDRKCPKEGCKGFLNSKTFICGICESQVCKHCNEFLTEGEEHTCNPDHVATVALINKDSKPCPSCGTLIFKISGCDQMYCTGCHTAFSWRRGVIEKGAIHNPHFYEWRQQNGMIERNHHDIECGGLPNRYYLQLFDRDYSNNVGSSLMLIYRFVVHVEHVEYYRYETDNENNEDLRIQYMINELDEEQFKKLIQKREKNRYKKREYYLIFRMLHDTLADYLRQIDNHIQNESSAFQPRNGLNPQTIEIIQNLISETSKLRTFANNQFDSTAKSMNLKSICITRRWEVA